MKTRNKINRKSVAYEDANILAIYYKENNTVYYNINCGKNAKRIIFQPDLRTFRKVL